jgi:hypothetical protein
MGELIFQATQSNGAWTYGVRTTADNVNFAFPGADYDAQVQSAQAFANSLRAGQQAGIDWLQTNLNDPMGENVAGWAGNLYDEMFNATSDLVVNCVIEFVIGDAIHEGMVDATATMLSDVIDADADFFGSMLAALIV